MVTTDAKLSLVEFLLAADDVSVSAQHGLEWLCTHVGVQRALCATAAVDPRRYWGVAALGISPAQTGEFFLDLEDETDPLVAVAYEPEPVHFPIGPRQPETPLESTPFTVIPLRSGSGSGRGDRKPAGLLLIGTDQPTLDPDVLWFADVLGEKLTRLRNRTIQTDRGLDRERQLLYNIINAVTDPILLTDASGKLIIGNRHAELLFAARDDESEGRRRAVALNNMFFSSALASRAMDMTGTTARELVLVDPDDGSDLLFEFLTSPVKEFKEFQEDSALVSVLRNVTDLGQARRELEENYRRLHIAEAAARAERNRLDLIVDSVVDPIIVSDPTGDILMTNAPAEKFFTVPPDSGGPEAQRRVSSNEAHFSSFVSSLLLSGADARWRGRVALADPATGRMVPVEAVAGKMMSDQAELTAIVTVFHDQTETIEKERLYDELRRASDQLEVKVQAATAELEHQNTLLRNQAIALEQASAAKSQFLANISHEFRTPLNAILGYTSMLLNGAYGEVLDTHRRIVSRVDANSRHLLALISDILDISRIEAGRMPLQLSTFAIDDLVRQVSEELDAMIQRSPVAVEFAIAPRVPPIRSDRQKVKQILVNLLSNALKFTHEGSIRVVTAYDRGAGMLTIEVRDSGIGIAPTDQARIFEDFQQVDSSPTRSYGGTGLGLSICRRFADMLGGRIALQSTLGQGSTFILSLPTRTARAARRGSVAEERQPEALQTT